MITEIPSSLENFQRKVEQRSNSLRICSIQNNSYLLFYRNELPCRSDSIIAQCEETEGTADVSSEVDFTLDQLFTTSNKDSALDPYLKPAQDAKKTEFGSVDQVFNNYKCVEQGAMLYLNKTNTGYEKWKQGAYTVTVGFNKYSKLKKKNRTISRSKVITIKNKKTKITYIKKSGNKKIKINKKTGKVTVRKGLKKGTYKIVVAVTAAESAVYKSRTKKVTFRIRVK